VESFASENDDEVMSGDLEWRYEYCCIGAVEQQWRDRAGRRWLLQSGSRWVAGAEQIILVIS